jgi:hypothetical protein
LPQAQADHERMLKVNTGAQGTPAAEIGRRVAGIYKTW